MLQFLANVLGGTDVTARKPRADKARLGMEVLEGRLAPSGDLTDSPPPPTAVEVSILLPVFAQAREKARVLPPKSE